MTLLRLHGGRKSRAIRGCSLLEKILATSHGRRRRRKTERERERERKRKRVSVR